MIRAHRSLLFISRNNALKRITVYISILLLIMLSACAVSNDTDYITVPFGGDNKTPVIAPSIPLPDYPIIDGSSSTRTMHMAIRAYLTDAHFGVQHSQTYAALERLIPGCENPADVILAVKYYDEVIEDANSRGADLVITPIAKEGFVFILHKDNPIDSLTQQQLRDIFSGKVTNWKELGGKDEQIVPMQRNWDSGSQTAMEEFMGDVPLTDMKEDDSIKLAISMSDMVETVWTTGSGAIGYNIYSWTAGYSLLYGGEVKFISVDGVESSLENLANDSYPLIVYTYSYYNNGNVKGKTLTDWLLTDEGQYVISSAGYVGIDGIYSTDPMPDFHKDESNSMTVAETYYEDSGLLDRLSGHVQLEIVFDENQTEIFADGKNLDVTVLCLAHFIDYTEDDEYMRFIVLTRERGGEFVIINEGEVLSYEDGVIIPQQ